MNRTTRAAAAALALAGCLAGPARAHAAPGDLDRSFDADGKVTFDTGAHTGAAGSVLQPDGKLVLAGTSGTPGDFSVVRLNADGSLDPTFDGDGRAAVDFGGTDQAFAVARQADGKLVVVGQSSVDNDVAVARLNPDGSLDDEFDGDGKKRFGYAGYDGAQAVAVQPDGKIVIAGFGGPDTVLAVTRLNPDGSFDTGFDGDGTSGADFGGSDSATAVALQPDGKILVSGTTSEPNTWFTGDFAIARFKPDGSLDTTFNFDGKTTINFGGWDGAYAAALQSNGKIVLAGFGAGDSLNVAVARLNADGSRDTSFDGDGKKTFGGGVGRAVLLQPDGKLVIAGYANLDFAAWRLNANGSVDTTFDGDGAAAVDFAGGSDTGITAALAPSGKLLVAGITDPGKTAVMRLNANGALDLTYGGDAQRILDYGGNDVAQAVLVQPDGRLVVAGTGSPDGDVEVTRLNATGTLDAGFGAGGTSAVDFGAFDEGYAIARQADGKLVVAGHVSANDDVAVARLNPDGSPDATFGGDGRRILDYGLWDYARAVLVQPNGKIVLVGDGGAGHDLEIARLNADGSTDLGFGFNGTVAVDLGGNEFGFGAALQRDGKIVVAGTTTVNFDAAVVRLNANGSLDTTFDGDGRKTFGFGDYDGARAVVVQPDGKLDVAGFGGAGTTFMVTRLNANGSFDTSFDGDGSAAIEFGGFDQPYSAALQANGKLVVAGYTTSNGGDTAVARLNPNGSPDATFSGDGKTTYDDGSGLNFANAVALQANGRIVLAGYSSQSYDASVVRLIGDPAPGGAPAS